MRVVHSKKTHRSSPDIFGLATFVMRWGSMEIGIIRGKRK